MCVDGPLDHYLPLAQQRAICVENVGIQEGVAPNILLRLASRKRLNRA